MLKTYRIIPLVFILFLFGFTLITVAPVFAWDPSMGMRHPDRPCMKNAREKGPRFGCGPDMRSPEQIASDPYDTGPHNPKLPLPKPKKAGPPPPPGGLGADCEESCQLKARIADLEAENATLREQQGAPADQSGGEVDQLNAKIAKLEAEHASRELQPCNREGVARYGRSICRLDVPQLRAKISDLEGTIAWHCAAPRKNSACGR